MKIFQKKLNKAPAYEFEKQYKDTDLLFFDIETTGFSAKTTVLYLIGCVYCQSGEWYSIQWFADDNTSEKNMLVSFFEFLKGYKLLIHFNGDGFDIPYILRKCEQHGLDYNFSSIESFDIYKKVSPIKKFLKLENLKQKTIEKFLDIPREDAYSGGELIQIYGNYLRSRYAKTDQSEELLSLLLLHNQEDIENLLLVTEILYYADIFSNDLYVSYADLAEEELILSIHLKSELPKRISFGNDNFYFLAFRENATLKVKLYKNELKFFYDNYKDYYYLPQEDTAIHKSVAFYVDKDFRTKAKAATCYSKKTGSFVPQFHEIVSPYFKIDYFDKVTYVETTNDFLNDRPLLGHYAKHILQNMNK